MSQPISRRHLLGGLSALATLPVLAACGTSAGDPAATSAASAGGVEEGAFPVTIKHKYGETTIEKAPERVVCIGLIEQDMLLAVDVAPVGVTKWFGDAPGFIFPWATDKLGDRALPTVLDNTNGVPVEKVAALKPDLIIGLYAGTTQAEYDLLSKLAPTVAHSGDHPDYGMPWDLTSQIVGQAVGRPKAMEAVIADVKGQIAKAKDEHPEFAGQSAAVVTPYEGLWVYGTTDPRTRMLTDLGFVFPEYFSKDEKAEFGFSTSPEKTAEMDDIGVAIWLDLAKDKPVQTLFQKTKAYSEGRWFDIGEKDGAYYVAHSFVTPLSIPYVLERYIPQLAAACDGDPKTEPPTPAS